MKNPAYATAFVAYSDFVAYIFFLNFVMSMTSWIWNILLFLWDRTIIFLNIPCPILISLAVKDFPFLKCVINSTIHYYSLLVGKQANRFLLNFCFGWHRKVICPRMRHVFMQLKWQILLNIFTVWDWFIEILRYFYFVSALSANYARTILKFLFMAARELATHCRWTY